MQTRQTIAVIGATELPEPSVLKNVSRGNYRLLLCSDAREQVALLAGEIRSACTEADVEAVPCSYDACWEADIILVCAPHDSLPDIADKIREVANRKIVVSLANTASERSYDALSGSAAERLKLLLPNATVVKAFYPLPTSSFERDIDYVPARPLIGETDEEAMQPLRELAQTAGFNCTVAL